MSTPFRKFSKEENVSSFAQLKASVTRGIRAQLCEQYPYLEETAAIEFLIPKKAEVKMAKCTDFIQILVVNNEPRFCSIDGGPWFPTLRVLHMYPDMMPKLRTDAGAIKFVLGGANIMCPGLTHKDAVIHNEVPAGTPVAIYAAGKEHAMAIGLTKMSTEDIRKINKDIGVMNLHYLNDGLWNVKDFS